VILLKLLKHAQLLFYAIPNKNMAAMRNLHLPVLMTVIINVNDR